MFRTCPSLARGDRAIKLAQFEGDFTDKRYLVDYSERRRYVELAAKLLGYLVEKVQVPCPEEAPLNFKLNVHFRDSIDGRPVDGEADENAGSGTEEPSG